MASNVQITRQNTLNHVMGTLVDRQQDILGMLPHDLPFERFQANILNALRSNAQLLDADSRSLVEACMKAAYDGLRIDSREAAIVTHETTFFRGTPRERKALIAQYYPMAFGIIQQILRGGEVASMYADVIRENDEYEVRRGTNPGIHHRPLLEGVRGSIIGAYSVATLKNGAVTFEFLDRQDLADIRREAKTDKVWKRWEGEQSKKSAVRRHRKTLPLGERDIVIRDSEAEDLYPDMNPQGESLPAPTHQPRPTRQAIADRQGQSAGVEMDLEDDDGVVIDQGEKTLEQGKVQNELPATNKSRETLKSADMPEDEIAWSAWAKVTEQSIMKAIDAEAVNGIAMTESDRLNAASKGRADYLRGLITDRLADFATGEQS